MLGLQLAPAYLPDLDSFLAYVKWVDGTQINIQGNSFRRTVVGISVLGPCSREVSRLANFLGPSASLPVELRKAPPDLLRPLVMVMSATPLEPSEPDCGPAVAPPHPP